MIKNSIEKCDIDMKRDLYRWIILCGGVTMLDGFPERVDEEITNDIFPIYNVKVKANPDRLHADWIGGSFLASLATFPQFCITHDDYNDAGPIIAHRMWV